MTATPKKRGLLGNWQSYRNVVVQWEGAVIQLVLL